MTYLISYKKPVKVNQKSLLRAGRNGTDLEGADGRPAKFPTSRQKTSEIWGTHSCGWVRVYKIVHCCLNYCGPDEQRCRRGTYVLRTIAPSTSERAVARPSRMRSGRPTP